MLNLLIELIHLDVEKLEKCTNRNNIVEGK
jgi:hypothetical protein